MKTLTLALHALDDGVPIITIRVKCMIAGLGRGWNPMQRLSMCAKLNDRAYINMKSIQLSLMQRGAILYPVISGLWAVVLSMRPVLSLRAPAFTCLLVRFSQCCNVLFKLITRKKCKLASRIQTTSCCGSGLEFDFEFTCGRWTDCRHKRVYMMFLCCCCMADQKPRMQSRDLYVDLCATHCGMMEIQGSSILKLCDWHQELWHVKGWDPGLWSQTE